jgi:hypothetical protein
MKISNLCLIASLCGVCLLTSACTTCPTHTHDNRGYHEEYHKDKNHKKHHKHKKQQSEEIAIFQQSYTASDIDNVNATIFTRSTKGGTSEMGTIWFQETPDGLKMMADLIDLRPGKSYTAEIYQCGACNDNTCCAMEAMSVDLPKLKVNNSGDRLQETYIIRGLTATQLNNAKIVLTRDGGYKAAWGTLK